MYLFTSSSSSFNLQSRAVKYPKYFKESGEFHILIDLQAIVRSFKVFRSIFVIFPFPVTFRSFGAEAHISEAHTHEFNSKHCDGLRPNAITLEPGSAAEVEAHQKERKAKGDMKAADYGEYLYWSWKVKRDGAGDCIVQLVQFKTVEDATVDERKFSFRPVKDRTHAPNLMRCAVVSAPERDIAGEPIAARLNKNVGDALAAAKKEAAQMGFA